MKLNMRIILVASIYTIWAALVILKLTPVDGFVNILTSGLTALGVLHVQNQGQS